MKRKNSGTTFKNIFLSTYHIKFSLLTLFLWVVSSSCSPLHYLNTFQSDNQFKRIENLNFAGEKANTQWWYYDCFFEDGSVLVLLFAPHQWWDEEKKITSDKSLFYISYMYANREVRTFSKVFDYQDLIYDENSLTCPYFKIVKAHEKKNRTYSLSFNLDEIKGSAVIKSTSKGFSPFPTGSMGKLATRHILKLKGKDLAFRYISQVPQGEVSCHLKINEKNLDLSGKAYHEQGWFTGLPDQLGQGWNWFHFVSENVNIFGKPGDFLCLEKNGKRLLGGVSFKESILSEKVYADNTETFLVGGKLNFSRKKYSFEITPANISSVPLINISSIDTDQLWGTVAQPSIIFLRNNGVELKEKGILLLESCKMSKGRSIPE